MINQPDLFTRDEKYLDIMGISSDIMHDFVAKEIRAIYSSYDGWKITPKKTGNGYDTMVTVERRNHGHRECVRILVTYDRVVSSTALTDLQKPEQVYDGTLSRNRFAVMVPANADTTSVPPGISVYTMKSFAFEGKELAWVKKPVRKAEAAPTPA
jgi:hypothetical protein